MTVNVGNSVIESVDIADSSLAKQITEFVRDNTTELLFNHSSRVYHFAALAGVRGGLCSILPLQDSTRILSETPVIADCNDWG